MEGEPLIENPHGSLGGLAIAKGKGTLPLIIRKEPLNERLGSHVD
jgi:hypothetical protein